MSELNAKARALVDAARAKDGAPPAARDRVRHALEARLGAQVFEPGHDGVSPRVSPGPAGPAGGASAASAGAGAAKLAGAVLAALSIFGAGVWIGRASVAPTQTAASVAPPQPAESPSAATTASPAATAAADGPSPPVPPAPTAEAAPREPIERRAPAVARALPAPSASPAAPSVAPAPPRSAVPPTPTPSAAAAADTLGPETTLLRDAQRSMREGDASAALQKLEAMGSAFPNGVLREERSAARVLALCAAGKVDEARAEAQRFLRETPRSPVAERVRASCGGTSARP